MEGVRMEKSWLRQLGRSHLASQINRLKVEWHPREIVLSCNAFGRGGGAMGWKKRTLLEEQRGYSHLVGPT